MRGRHAGRTTGDWRASRKRYRATGKSPSAIESAPRTQRAQADVPCPGCTTRRSARPRKPCATWTTPSPTSSAAANSSKQGKLRGKLGYPKRKTRKRGLGGFRLTGSIVVSRRDPVAPPGASSGSKSGATSQLAQGPLGDRERAGGTLVRLGAGGARAHVCRRMWGR